MACNIRATGNEVPEPDLLGFAAADAVQFANINLLTAFI